MSALNWAFNSIEGALIEFVNATGYSQGTRIPSIDAQSVIFDILLIRTNSCINSRHNELKTENWGAKIEFIFLSSLQQLSLASHSHIVTAIMSLAAIFKIFQDI